MPGRLNDIAFNIRAVVEIVAVVVIPVVTSLLILDLVRRVRKYIQQTVRGFEVMPAPPPAQEP